MPFDESVGDHVAGEGDGAEEKEQPEDSVRRGDRPIQYVAHAVDGGPTRKLLKVFLHDPKRFFWLHTQTKIL